MPYSGPNDPSLPDNVKSKSEDARQKWVSTFNNVFDDCTEDGGSKSTCEGKAFAIANAGLEDRSMTVRADPPNYRKSGGTQVCANCEYELEGQCQKYGIQIKADYVCDSWEPKEMMEMEVKKSVKNEKPRNVNEGGNAVRRIRNLVEAMRSWFGNPIQQRTMSLERVWEQLWMRLEDEDGMMTAWPIDLYYDRGGLLFAILAKDGQLFRQELVIQDDNVTLGNSTRVEEIFVPVPRSTHRIVDLPDGKTRVVAIASTSVLNRVGEIDTRALYDSFIENMRTGRATIDLNYAHLKEIKLGTVDYAARDGYCYVVSYVFDDTPIGRAAAEGLKADPDYWGYSIEFVSDDRQLVEVAENVAVRVYENGVNTGLALLREGLAASLFTGQAIKRSFPMDKLIKQDLVHLIGEEEAEVAESMIDGTNRSIEDAALIARSVEESQTIEETEAVEETVVVGETEVVEEEEEVQLDLLESHVEQVVYEMTPETENELASVIANSAQFRTAVIDPLVERLARLEQSIQTLIDQGNDRHGATAATLKKLNQRLEVLEKDESTRKADYIKDLPKPSRTVTVVRPNQSEAQAANGKKDNAQQIAESTLAKLPRLPR